MSRQVEILYTGIVGLVPEPATNSFKVVVQNASHAHHGEKPHVAWLAVEHGRATLPAGLRFLASNADDRLRAYELAGWDAEFENRVTSGPLRETGNFHRFILRLEDGCGRDYADCDRIDRRFLSLQDPMKISARFPIRQGQLDAGHIEEGLLWEWDLPGAARQRITQEAIHRFTIEEDELVLRLRHGSDDRRVVLRSLPSEPILLIVGNTLEDDIFPNEPPKPEDDLHVKLYYDLAAVDYPMHARPKLVRRIASPQKTSPSQEGGKMREYFLRTHGSNCPPGLWSS